jgi:hypothetical protein
MSRDRTSETLDVPMTLNKDHQPGFQKSGKGPPNANFSSLLEMPLR